MILTPDVGWHPARLQFACSEAALRIGDAIQFNSDVHSGQSITARQIFSLRQCICASHVHAELQRPNFNSQPPQHGAIPIELILNKLIRECFFFFFVKFLHASIDTRSGIQCVASEPRALAGTRPVRTDALLQILLFPACLFPKGEPVLLQEATSIVRST